MYRAVANRRRPFRPRFDRREEALGSKNSVYPLLCDVARIPRQRTLADDGGREIWSFARCCDGVWSLRKS